MADAREHAEVVLSGILPARKDLLDKALLRLTPDHFPDKTQRNLFTFLERYADQTGSVLPLKHLEDMLRGRVSAGQSELFTESYALYAETPVDDSDFHWSVEQLRELLAEKATGTALSTAMEILRTGRTDDTGETEKGHAAARAHLMEALATIDREVTQQEAPEGSLKDERDDMLADYEARKAARLDGSSRGILFGVENMDAKVGGMQPGELWLVAGYSSDGKTSFAVQSAWSAAIEQGENVLFLTTETLRPQVRRKLIARHSTQEMFGLPDGLNTRDLKAGTLTEAQEDSLRAVVNDFTTNPAYGQIYVAQVPRGASISHIEQRMYRVARKLDFRYVVMDYLALLAPDRRKQTTREELAAIMKEAKQVTTTFDGGRGVVLLSPWQVSRAAREQAEKLGLYSSASLSETAEATNSADGIISVFAPTDNTNRRTEVTGQVLKNRDGETANGLIMDVDYATSKFSSRSLQFAPVPQAPTGMAGAGFGGLGSLIS